MNNISDYFQKDDKSILESSFVYNGLNTIQSILFGLLTSLLFTRILGLEIFGKFSLVASYISIFFSVITTGILTGFKREAIRYSTNEENVGNFLFIIFLFTVIATVLFSAIILFFENSFFDLFNIQKEYRNVLILYLLSYVLIYVPGSLIIFTLESFQDIKPIFKISLLSNFIKTIGILSLIFFALNVHNAIIVYFLIPNFIIVFFSYNHIKKNYNFKLNLKELKYSLKSLKKVFSYSLKLYPLMLAELILGNIAIIILSKTHSVEIIGVFKVLFNYYLVIKFVPLFFGKVISPTLTKLVFEHKNSKVVMYYNFTFKLSVLICSLLTILFIGYTSELLSIYGIYGKEYTLSMIILLLSNLVLAGCLIGAVFQAYNYPQFISIFVGIGSIINFGLSISLIPSYGILGACIAIFAANLVSQLGLHLFAIKKIKFKIPISKFLISFSIVIVYLIIGIYLNNYIEMILFKTLYILSAIIANLILLKVFGFFNKKELSYLVSFSEKYNNKTLNRLMGYFTTNKDI